MQASPPPTDACAPPLPVGARLNARPRAPRRGVQAKPTDPRPIASTGIARESRIPLAADAGLNRTSKAPIVAIVACAGRCFVAVAGTVTEAPLCNVGDAGGSDIGRRVDVACWRGLHC